MSEQYWIRLISPRHKDTSLLHCIVDGVIVCKKFKTKAIKTIPTRKSNLCKICRKKYPINFEIKTKEKYKFIIIMCPNCNKKGGLWYDGKKKNHLCTMCKNQFFF